MTTTFEPNDSFTRPADANQYTVGDLVANSTTAASVVPLEFDFGAVAYNTFIRRVRLYKNDGDLVSASFRLHLFKTAPTVITSGDNGAAFVTTTPLVSNSANYIGALDSTMDRNFTDGAFGVGVPMNGNEISLANCGRFVYGFLEARATYTPASGETFTAVLEAHRY